MAKDKNTHSCNCELYYFDTALRERCVKYAIQLFAARPDVGGDIKEFADRILEYIYTPTTPPEKK